MLLPQIGYSTALAQRLCLQQPEGMHDDRDQYFGTLPFSVLDPRSFWEYFVVLVCAALVLV